MMMMTRSGMEVLSPNSTLFSNPNCFVVGGDKRSTGKWTQQENKMFENALAHIDFQSPDMWDRLAQLLPGKTVRDIISHYRDLVDDVNHIEAGGLIQFPGYTASSSSSPSSSSSSSFTLHWESGFDGIKQEEGYCVGSGGKRSGGRLFDQERKKGVPWTEEEHKLFLMGLKKYGKGDWRNISRNSVVTRTPTQVASHAQKYFIRLNSGGKDKRRASIHDITTVNLPDNSPPSPSQPSAISMQSTNSSIDQPNEAASGFTPLKQNNRFVHLPYGINPYGVKLEGHHSHIAATVLDSMFVHRTYA